eukprot:973562-Amphidinium_carterae.2
MWSKTRARVPCSAPHAVHVVDRTRKARGALKRRGQRGHWIVPGSSSGSSTSRAGAPASSSAGWGGGKSAAGASGWRMLAACTVTIRERLVLGLLLPSSTDLAILLHSAPAGTMTASQSITVCAEGNGNDRRLGQALWSSRRTGSHSVHSELGPVAERAAFTWLFSEAQTLGRKVAMRYCTSLSQLGSATYSRKSSSRIGRTKSVALSMTVFFRSVM